MLAVMPLIVKCCGTITRQHEILLVKEELDELQTIIKKIIDRYNTDIDNHFIAESAEKLRKIYFYYAAYYGLNPFPYKRCNAPWVSTVIEADGTVRPCFFHNHYRKYPGKFS